MKTDRSEMVAREAEGVRRLSVYFTGAQAARIFPSGSGPPEAIIYPLVSVDNSGTIIEFKELVFQPSQSRPPDRPSSVELLRSTYESCRTSHATRQSLVTVGPQYEAYLRETPERLLNDPLPDVFPDGQPTTIYGQRLRDPRRILDSVRQLQFDTVVCPVHGDLHPSNVLFGRNFVPVLIDYAFGHLDGHFIKDFVLMEISLRFLQVSRLLQPDMITRLDDALLEEYGYDEILHHPVSGHTGEVLREIVDLVTVIRQECRFRHPGYDFIEYLAAQYMVLTGALRLLPYQEFRTLRALCRLADRLEQAIA